MSQNVIDTFAVRFVFIDFKGVDRVFFLENRLFYNYTFCLLLCSYSSWDSRNFLMAAMTLTGMQDSGLGQGFIVES